MGDGDEPPLASAKHNYRERLILVRSTDFVGQHEISDLLDFYNFDAVTILPEHNVSSGVRFDNLKSFRHVYKS